jgi:hypothetical protein
MCAIDSEVKHNTKKAGERGLTDIADTDGLDSDVCRYIPYLNVESEQFRHDTRRRMEWLLLAAFKHNMSLNDKGLLNKFIHIISVDRLQIMIAEEFLEKDMLKMVDTEFLFSRITQW